MTRIVALDRVHVHLHSDEQAYLHYDALARNGGQASLRDGGIPVRVGLASEAFVDGAGRYLERRAAELVQDDFDGEPRHVAIKSLLERMAP